MDIEKRIEDLEKKLMRLESRYSQSNPVDVLEIRALKKEIARLEALLATGKGAKVVKIELTLN
jgi:ribosomal protein L29